MNINLLSRVKLFWVMRYTCTAVLKLIYIRMRENLFRVMNYIANYELSYLRIRISSNIITLQWRHNESGSASNHQRLHCLLNCRFRRRWKKTSKLRVTGLCLGNSPVTGHFPTQKASKAENVSIWWRHHQVAVDVRFSNVDLATSINLATGLT